MADLRRNNTKSSIRIYALTAYSPTGDKEALEGFAALLGQDVLPELEQALNAPCQYHLGEAMHLDNTNTRRADDFIRESLLRMVQTPCDVVLVVTDTGIVSESQLMVPGLAAPEAQVVVISTRKLLAAPYGEPVRSLDSPAVRWNAAALFLHLMGHLLGLKHRGEGVMAPFTFREECSRVPGYSQDERTALAKAARKLRVREVPTKGHLHHLVLHLNAAVRNPREVLALAWRSKAILLPFTLTKITTAALAPAFLMFFTDEFWWAGINLPSGYIWSAAAAAILGATCYIPFSQELLFPHREKRVLTSNVAIVNIGMFLTMFFMVVGLFIIITLAILILELWLFPADFIMHWFTDFGFQVGWHELLKIAVVVSTLGTLTGALGSGFIGQKIIRAVSLFCREP